VVYDRGVLDAPFGVRQSLFVIFDRCLDCFGGCRPRHFPWQSRRYRKARWIILTGEALLYIFMIRVVLTAVRYLICQILPASPGGRAGICRAMVACKGVTGLNS
jgi:hypothetical protein